MSVENVISALEYDKWVANWQTFHDKSEFSELFFDETGPHTGMVFDFNSLYYLLSTTGIVSVKIRFGINDSGNGEAQTFHLVLFGADDNNETITPYFVSQQYTYDTPVPTPNGVGGNLPRILMEKWENSWLEQIVGKTVGQQMFNFRYGFLQGYTYPLKEVMDALGAFQGASNIYIKYGLHEYYPLYPEPGNDLTPMHTFGVVLYAGRVASNGTGQVIDESGYYDLTAPCPHTC